MTYHVELHSLRCYRDDEGTLRCSCVPVVLRESPDVAASKWDNTDTEGDSVIGYNARGSELGITPRLRAVRHSRVIR